MRFDNQVRNVCILLQGVKPTTRHKKLHNKIGQIKMFYIFPY